MPEVGIFLVTAAYRAEGAAAAAVAAGLAGVADTIYQDPQQV
jgi:hypothetical protein